MSEAIETTEEWAAVMILLNDLDIDEITIEYSGGGDSGAIDTVYFSGSVNLKITENLKRKIENSAYKILNEIEDWWNNDGGSGEMIITVPTGEYQIRNTIRLVNYNTYEHEGHMIETLIEE